MFKTIEGAADCEIQSVIRFLNARNVLPSEIRYQIYQVYIYIKHKMAVTYLLQGLDNWTFIKQGEGES